MITKELILKNADLVAAPKKCIYRSMFCKIVSRSPLVISYLGEDLTIEDENSIVFVPLSDEALSELADKLLAGESIELEEETSTELLDTKAVTTIKLLKEKAELYRASILSIKLKAQKKIDDLRAVMLNKVHELEEVNKKLKAKIEKFDYVIQTIELYAGIKEHIVQLASGTPADESEDITLHQAVIYADEELALEIQDFDWRKFKRFEEWLLKDDNFKKLLPFEKSVVAIKPRRTNMKYSDNSFENFIFNEPNKKTMFLIRNGENLYSLKSENIALDDRLFPNKNYFEDLQKNPISSYSFPQDRQALVERERKRYTAVLFLIQGLIDRSDVFAPFKKTVNLMKSHEIPEGISLIYELEASLTDGKPNVIDWMLQKNKLLSKGKRIVALRESFSEDDFVRYYEKRAEPALPTDGIYTLVQNKNYSDHSYYQQRFAIQYLPQDEVYVPSKGFVKRSQRVSINVDINSTAILNYDDTSIEEIDYYLNSRAARSLYFRYVKKLLLFKRIYKQEEENEKAFSMLLISEVSKAGYAFKPGIDPMYVASLAINRLKTRLKWKRFISTKEQDNLTLIKRTMLSKQFCNDFYTVKK